mgnify:CR=1 FL=1
MKIAVVGTGYVGLVTGTCFAETGNDVVCVDIDAQKVASMKAGNIPIYEPHLDVLFERNIKAGRLAFTTSLSEAVADATLIFLALPTPPGEDGSADLSYVLGVAGELGKMIKDYKVIIDKIVQIENIGRNSIHIIDRRLCAFPKGMARFT